MNIPKIEKTCNDVAPLIAGEYPDAITRTKLKKLMEAFLPEYEIKCDEENNTPEAMDAGNIMVTVSTPKRPNGSLNYVNIIF
jgi:hypothetical protein